jgi:hypothetical protein
MYLSVDIPGNYNTAIGKINGFLVFFRFFAFFQKCTRILSIPAQKGASPAFRTNCLKNNSQYHSPYIYSQKVAKLQIFWLIF